MILKVFSGEGTTTRPVSLVSPMSIGFARPEIAGCSFCRGRKGLIEWRVDQAGYQEGLRNVYQCTVPMG